jgi:hypothetical protein
MSQQTGSVLRIGGDDPRQVLNLLGAAGLILRGFLSNFLAKRRTHDG